jgi:soluble lytic murein transglycosylase-like protein
MGFMLLAFNFGSPPEVETEAVETPKVAVDDTRQRNLAERENKLWNNLVTKIAQKTHIRDRYLAERVTRALESASVEFGVDPWLMASLIRVESSGRPEIVSRVGAVGLTQIMPATGRQIARELSIEGYSTQSLYNPEINIRMGAYYVRYLLDRFDGDLHTALAAYNWGPNHISRRLARQQALPVQYPEKILRRI